MIQKKICMLGYFSVGKTSLVEQFVRSIFSEKYQSTLGVKVDKKIIDVDGQEVSLMLWDLAGDNSYINLKQVYLKGSAGFLVVADGTRSITLETALDIKNNLQKNYPDVPFIILLNKSDLQNQWETEQADIKKLEAEGIKVVLTSAKTGDLVEETFTALGRLILKKK